MMKEKEYVDGDDGKGDDDERPSLSSYSRRVLAQYWLLKEKFLGSESGCAAAAPR